MKDLREGLPSASSAHADNLCGGRHLAQIGLSDDASDDAAYGIAVDKAMGGDMAALTMEQEDTVLAAREIEERVLELWKTGEGLIWKKRHIRLWDDPLDHHNSGELDALWIIGNRALISDLKSLYGDIPEAASNMQLRDYAVLVWLNFGCTEITCYINQPKVTRKPEHVLYTLPDLERAYEEMQARVARSMDPNSPRIPGLEQCKFCRARATCPEATGAMTSLAKLQFNWAALSPENKRSLFDACGQAGSVIHLIKSKIKEDLENGVPIPGLKLSPGKTLSPIVDVQEFWRRLNTQYSVTTDEFIALCGLGKGNSKKLLREKTGLKGEELEKAFKELTAGLTAEKKSERSIEMAK